MQFHFFHVELLLVNQCLFSVLIRSIRTDSAPALFLSDRSLSCLEIQQLFVSEGDTEYRDRELHYSKLNEHFLFLN